MDQYRHNLHVFMTMANLYRAQHYGHPISNIHDCMKVLPQQQLPSLIQKVLIKLRGKRIRLIIVLSCLVYHLLSGK